MNILIHSYFMQQVVSTYNIQSVSECELDGMLYRLNCTI